MGYDRKSLLTFESDNLPPVRKRTVNMEASGDSKTSITVC
jgi:hypothetical protein